jgi:hypothetical protein
MPKSEDKKTWLAWDGPHSVTAVKELTIEIDKRGEPTMVNKTTVVALKHEVIPPRNLKGQAEDLEEDDQKEQDARFKQKLNQVKERLKASEESSDEEAEDEENIEQKAIEIKSLEERLEKLTKKRPAQKRKYAAEEVKVGSMCIAFAMKRTRLCKVLVIHNQEGDPRPWIRVQMFAKTTKDEKESKPTWRPWWLGVKSRAFLESQPGVNHKEFWVDLYAEDILYILRHPLKKGEMNRKDESEITQLWGGTLNILTLQGEK